ncbi:MAG: transcription-repair coupling factor, partial [Actinomycetota bacterium]|nr:transcription-repair coupling factor [Actinomycetota bacterium]
MALRELLAHIDEDPAALALARDGGHAFVSTSLRPYVIAALAEHDAPAGRRAQLVVVGDDRAAREVAGDLRAWLAPRRVRYYPSRGVAYESHLRPPAHLVGLRMAALDALLAAGEDAGERSQIGPPVVVVSAVALSEKVPDLALRPRSFTLRVGELLDLSECATELIGAGYERVDQVEERGQFAMRGGLLDVFPATEERAVRVDMFDIEIESLRWFSTFTQRSLGEVQEVEIAPAAELAAEHRAPAQDAYAAAFAGARERSEGEETSARPDIAELLPVARFGALLDLIGEETELVVAAEEELGPALSDHWTDVCAAFADEDAHHLYVSPERIHAALQRRARTWLSAIASGQEIELRAQSADTPARTLAEAEPELEKLVRSGYRTVVAFPRRGEGERAAYNLGRLKATWLGEPGAGASSAPTPSLRFVAASLREGF